MHLLRFLRRRRAAFHLLAAAVALGLTAQPCLAAPGSPQAHHGTAALGSADVCCLHWAEPDRHIGKAPAALLAGKIPAPAPITVASIRLPWTAEDKYWVPAAGYIPAPPLALYLRLERLLI